VKNCGTVSLIVVLLNEYLIESSAHYIGPIPFLIQIKTETG